MKKLLIIALATATSFSFAMDLASVNAGIRPLSNAGILYSELPMNSIISINKDVINPIADSHSIFFMDGQIVNKLPPRWSDLINQPKFFCEVTQLKQDNFNLRKLNMGENFIIDWVGYFTTGNDDPNNPDYYYYYKANVAASITNESDRTITRFVCYDRKEDGKSIEPTLADVKRTFGDYIRVEIDSL